MKSEDQSGCLQIEVDYVVGVDTHRDEHVLAVVAAPTGAVVAQRSVRATLADTRRRVRFADEHAPGARVWAVEGAGHYGAGLSVISAIAARPCIEAGRGPRNERRLRGKDDPLDAIRAARTALASEDARAATIGAAAGGSTGAPARAPQRRRRPPARARAAAQRDRDRARASP